MLQERRRTVTFFGLGSAAIALMVGGALALNSPEGTNGAKPAIMHTAKTFQAMERPDPVLLLTPVQLPDHTFASR